MIDKIDFEITRQEFYLKSLNDSKFDENITKGEIVEIHREIYAVQYGVHILKQLKG
tara:strand:+ start:33 stop:200 length:168 start_codon:yes stop_codon:yes gene_type:complete